MNNKSNQDIYVFAILDTRDHICSVTWPAPDRSILCSEHDAWMSFFQVNGAADHRYRLPLEEAIRAYKSIGYRAIKYKLIEVQDKKQCCPIEDDIIDDSDYDY